MDMAETHKLRIPEGHHPGLALAALAKRKEVSAKDFSLHMNISYMIVKRFFAGRISIHPATVNIVADAARYFLGVAVDENELLRAQQSHFALVAREKSLSKAALNEALKDVDLSGETRHIRALARRKEQDKMHAAAMKRKEAK
jgi:hypothetical protein